MALVNHLAPINHLPVPARHPVHRSAVPSAAIQRQPLGELAVFSDNCGDRSRLRFVTKAPLVGPNLVCRHTICAGRRVRISRALWLYYPGTAELLDKRGNGVRTDGDMQKHVELTETHRRVLEGRCTIQDRENYYASALGLASDDSTSPKTEEYNEASPTYFEID